MRNIKNKKGSHVEVVISFAIFVTFLVFLYAALEPAVGKPKTKEYIMESIKPRVIEYVSSNVYSYSLDLNEKEQNPISSFEITEPGLLTKNATVKANGQKLESLFFYDFSESRNVLSINRGSNEDFIIYTSDEFGKGEYTTASNQLAKCTSSTPIDESCYSITQTETEKYVFKSKIEKMKIEYETNSGMLSLRTAFKIPSGTNFYFKLVDENKQDLVTPLKEEIEGDVSIYVEETPVSFIENTGDDKDDPEKTKIGFLVVEIW
jgi:hypothetical protein